MSALKNHPPSILVVTIWPCYCDTPLCFACLEPSQKFNSALVHLTVAFLVIQVNYNLFTALDKTEPFFLIVFTASKITPVECVEPVQHILLTQLVPSLLQWNVF